MSRALYEAIATGAPPADPPGADWLSALAGAAADARRRSAGGLAQAEFLDGLHVREDEAWAMSEEAPMEMAADDRPALSFPARYADDDWVLWLELSADGRPLAILEVGRGPVTLDIEGAEVALTQGAERPLPDLYAPPHAVVLVTGEGDRVTLTGEET